jgi:D-3-phosphoglycerate dehydrogenase
MKTSYPLDKIKVVLLEGVHQHAVDIFDKAGFQVERHDCAYHGQDLLDVAGDAHLIGLRSKTHLTKAFFDHATRLWGVGCFCIGTNQVDLEAAAEHGVPVFNAPFQNTRSVAELVISEIISLHRRLFDRSAAMHGGQWLKSAVGAHEIRGRTLGIVGYGRIGSQVSVLAEAMGMKVLFHDLVDVLPMGNAEQADSLHDLLARSDVVTLHVPATSETENLIGKAQLETMRAGSYLLNNARGNVVDIDALREVLLKKHLAGAAVDVFPKEPASNDEAFHSPLRGLDNVILTPHIGGSTIEAQQNIAESAATRLVRLMNNGTTASAVNVPPVQLPRLHANHHRIIHFHRNVPGVLSKLHRVIADLDINIAAEHLQSNPDHSYLILDISPSSKETDLREKLMAFEETLRVRILW